MALAPQRTFRVLLEQRCRGRAVPRAHAPKRLRLRLQFLAFCGFARLKRLRSFLRNLWG